MDTGLLVFLLLLGAMTLDMLSQVIKNRGWKGAMFGAPVRRKTGEPELSRRKMIKVRLKVYALDASEEDTGPHVGLELTQSALLSWHQSPVSLTRGGGPPARG